uniref:Alkylated DNA repair protein AlkB homologue 8 N-terminal domain-containing protein n=1 Tax=Hucho hucho TaxID=62062 RepID=A0A4W5JWH6_9TELE
MKLCGAYCSSHRYHTLAWGSHGMDAQGLPSGVLIAGGENGDVILYDPAKIIAGGKYFKFLGVNITDKLKWSTHTDSVMKKVQQRLFNLSRLKKFGLSPKTLTNFYRCTIESILLGCITAWYGNCSAHNRKALQRITGGKLPTLHLHHPMSQEGQKDHQGQQPPEPLPVHPAIIQKARSVQVHQSWDRETEKQLLSRGHQTVKQPSLTLSGCCQHTDSNL